jgi:hypothetical protein
MVVRCTSQGRTLRALRHSGLRPSGPEAVLVQQGGEVQHLRGLSRLAIGAGGGFAAVNGPA